MHPLHLTQFCLLYISSYIYHLPFGTILVFLLLLCSWFILFHRLKTADLPFSRSFRHSYLPENKYLFSFFECLWCDKKYRTKLMGIRHIVSSRLHSADPEYFNYPYSWAVRSTRIDRAPLFNGPLLLWPFPNFPLGKSPLIVWGGLESFSQFVGGLLS